MHNKLSIIGVYIFIISTCILFNTSKIKQETNSVSQFLATTDPNSTLTFTPFQPIPPTLTNTPSPTPEITNTPTPTKITYTPTATSWFDGLIRPKEQANILVLGSDYHPGGGFRTDMILLVSINPINSTVNVISFPRDLYVTIPGHDMNRLNTAQALGGFELMADTFQYNFGIRPDHYILTDFSYFVDIVDSLGGIDIDAATALTDRCDLPQAYKGYCTAGPGIVHMNGKTALWYVRSRYSTSDFDRNRREQEVLQALFKRLISLDAVARAQELFSTYRNHVVTDLGLGDILPWLPVATIVNDTGKIRRFYVGRDEVTSYTVPETGAHVLIPDMRAIYEILRLAIYSQ